MKNLKLLRKQIFLTCRKKQEVYFAQHNSKIEETEQILKTRLEKIPKPYLSFFMEYTDNL